MKMERRTLLCAAAAASSCIPWPARALSEPVSSPTPLLDRLDAGRLTPLSGQVKSREGELRYPAWLEGDWRASCRSAGFEMPLGARFVDPELIAEASRAAPRQYALRFVAAPGQPPAGQPELSVRQDRRFNHVEEERALISTQGFVVERGAYACDAAHPHGLSVLTILDTAAGPSRPGSASSGSMDPGGSGAMGPGGSSFEATPTFRFEEELEVLWTAWDTTELGGTFATSELTAQRVLLPAPGQAMAEEAGTSFLELLWRFERPAGAPMERPARVRARYRVAQYLGLPGVPAAASATPAARNLARQAAGQAVSILDYELVMERVVVDAE